MTLLLHQPALEMLLFKNKVVEELSLRENVGEIFPNIIVLSK